MDLKNSTMLITGGTSGIGLEFVKQLTEQGGKNHCYGTQIRCLERNQKKFPEVHTFQSDVSNPKDIEQLYRVVTQVFPNLNVIINKAGLMWLIDLQDTSLDLDKSL